MFYLSGENSTVLYHIPIFIFTGSDLASLTWWCTLCLHESPYVLDVFPGSPGAPCGVSAWLYGSTGSAGCSL